MIGDPLYTLTARDEQLTPLEIVRRAHTVVPAAALIVTDVIYTVPIDRTMKVMSTGFVGDPGAATLLTYMSMSWRESTTLPNIVFYARVFNAAAVDIDSAIADYDELYIPPGAQIVVTARFNAAGAANGWNAHLTGLLIPRGNFAL